jgi:hypothetical protein
VTVDETSVTKRDVLLLLVAAVLLVGVAFSLLSMVGAFDPASGSDRGLPAAAAPTADPADDGPPPAGTDDGTLVVTPEPTTAPEPTTDAPTPRATGTATTPPGGTATDDGSGSGTPAATPTDDVATPEPTAAPTRTATTAPSVGGSGGGAVGGSSSGGGGGAGGGSVPSGSGPGAGGGGTDPTEEAPSASVELGVDGLDAGSVVDAEGLAPGDSGTTTFTVVNGGRTAGSLAVTADVVADAEGGLLEPERSLGDTAADGELDDALGVRVAVVGEDGERTYLAGSEGAFVALSAVDGGPSTRLAGDESATVLVEWRVDVLAGNEVQSDVLAALLRFRLTTAG